MNPSAQVNQLLFASVRIETRWASGCLVGSGTSFVFSDPARPRDHRLFLVSNKHVVSEGESAYLFFTEQGADGQPVLGHRFFVDIDGFKQQWHGHSNPQVDVAVMPLSKQHIERDNKTAYIRPVSLSEVATPSDLEHIEATSPVIFIGYPNSMFDEKHYTPIARRGYVATPPDLDFNGEPVFLIDASVFCGSSGSPVFSYSDGRFGGSPHLKLLGIVAAVFTQQTDGRIKWIPAPTTVQPIPVIGQMIDLGKVFKARLIQETITSLRISHGI